MVRMATSGSYRRSLVNAVFALTIVFAHVLLLLLMLDAYTKPRIEHRSSPTIATWNIRASNAAPLIHRASDSKLSAVQVDVDAPTIAIEEAVPAAVSVDAISASDPYAGAALVRNGLGKAVNTPESLKRPIAAAHVDGDVFSRWVAELRIRLRPILSGRPTILKQIRTEILADPTGGFGDVRIVEGSGDLAVDRQILVDLMHHQELVERGRVGQPTWLALPVVDLMAASV